MNIIESMVVKTSEYKVTINEKWCKSCEICVAFCPKQILTMEKGKVVVIKPESCTGCQLCEIYCPDFAIKVTKNENSK